MCPPKGRWSRARMMPFSAYARMGPWWWGREAQESDQGPSGRYFPAWSACCCGGSATATKEELEAQLEWLKEAKARLEKWIEELEGRLREARNG
jgi:hypothetical protein